MRKSLTGNGYKNSGHYVWPVRAGLISNPDISLSPVSHDFGSVTVESSSLPQTFTISNIGTADLHISNIDLSDTTNYSLNVNGGTSPCGSTTPTIVPDNSCTVTVTFNPTSAGQKDANLTINSDDPDTPTLDVSLNGIEMSVVTCSLTPSGATRLSRASNLKFFASAQNNTDEVQVFQFATKVTLPNLNAYPSSGYLVGPITVTLEPHASQSKSLTQFIPYNAPFGTYTYHGYVGTVSPPLLYNQCQFNFSVNP